LKLDVTHEFWWPASPASETIPRPGYSVASRGTFTQLVAAGTDRAAGTTQTIRGAEQRQPELETDSLDPIFDAGAEWYLFPSAFARPIGPGLFYMDLPQLRRLSGSEIKTYYTFLLPMPKRACQVPYNLTVSDQREKARFGMAWNSPFTTGLSPQHGFIGNYTYADAKQTSNVQGPTSRLIPRPTLAGWHVEEHLHVSAYFREQNVQRSGWPYTYRCKFLQRFLDRKPTAFSAPDAHRTLSASRPGYNHERSFLRSRFEP